MAHECNTPFPFPPLGTEWTCPLCGLIWKLEVGLPEWETVGQVEVEEVGAEPSAERKEA
jgi:hypothetical protein